MKPEAGKFYYVKMYPNAYPDDVFVRRCEMALSDGGIFEHHSPGAQRCYSEAQIIAEHIKPPEPPTLWQQLWASFQK